MGSQCSSAASAVKPPNGRSRPDNATPKHSGPQAQQTHADQKAVQDELWHKLIAHHEPTVHDALEDAFEHNRSPAACIDVGKDFTTHTGARYATVLILCGPLDLVPERRTAVTPTGKAHAAQGVRLHHSCDGSRKAWPSHPASSRFGSSWYEKAPMR